MISRSKQSQLNRKIARMWVDAGGNTEDYRVQSGNIEIMILDLCTPVQKDDEPTLFTSIE